MRTRRRRTSLAAWTAGACAMAATLLGAFAQAAIPPPAKAPPDRALNVEIVGGIEETLTDNVALSPSDERSDAITSPILALKVDVDTPRAAAALNGEVRYDAYARESGRNGWSTTGTAAGSYTLVDDVLWFKGRGATTSGSLSTFATSAFDRHGAPDRVQLTTYDVGPEVRLKLGDSVALAGAARYAQAIYGGRSKGSDQPLPRDDSITQLVGSATVGARASRVQLQTAAEYLHDDLDFTSATGIESAFFRVSPILRLLGRAGYEKITQDQRLHLSAPVLSAGVEYRPNAASLLRVEGGRRYRRTAWSAEAVSRVTQRLYMAGSYSEALQPDQVAVVRSFQSFSEQADVLPPPLILTAFLPTSTLYNETSLNRSAEVRALYTRAGNIISATVDWTNRRFIVSGGRDRTLFADVAFSRQVRPELRLGLHGRYAHTFESPRFGQVRSYQLSAEAAYRVNSRTEIRASLARTDNHELAAGGDRVVENALLVGLRRRF